MKGRLWIAVEAKLRSRDVTYKCADSCDVKLNEAVGLLCNLWGSAAEDACAGHIKDKSDRQIEEWAFWDGERGVFAAFVRDECIDEAGKLKAWDEMQGPLEARREHDRTRQANRRARLKVKTESPVVSGEQQRQARDSHVTSNGTSRGTEQNRTEPETTSHHTAREAFLSVVSTDSRNGWDARLDAWKAGGLHSLGATDADIEKALEEFALNNPSPSARRVPNARQVEEYIRKCVEDRTKPARASVRLSVGSEIGESDEAWDRVVTTIRNRPWRELPRETFTARDWKGISAVNGLRAIAEMQLRDVPFVKRDFTRAYTAANTRAEVANVENV